MKTNLQTSVIAATVVGALLLAASTRITANNLPLVATVVSYAAVVGIAVMAVNDYRAASKGFHSR